MKRNAAAMILSLAVCLGLLPTAQAAGVNPAISNNKHAQQYTNLQRWPETVKSYLYVNSNGGLTRVEYMDGKVIIEDYDSQFQILSNRSIPVELPLWGGFYAGEDYNFVVFGQNNEEQSDEKEVVRVVKYSKDWQRLDTCSIKKANTYRPFQAGSLRFAECGGYLYIHACHDSSWWIRRAAWSPWIMETPTPGGFEWPMWTRKPSKSTTGV